MWHKLTKKLFGEENMQMMKRRAKFKPIVIIIKVLWNKQPPQFLQLGRMQLGRYKLELKLKKKLPQLSFVLFELHLYPAHFSLRVCEQCGFVRSKQVQRGMWPQ